MICKQCKTDKSQDDFYIDRKVGTNRENGYTRKSTVYRQPCKKCFCKNKKLKYQTKPEYRKYLLEQSLKYAHSEKGIEKRNIIQKKRSRTVKFKEYRKWWFKNTEKGKASLNRRRKRWLKTANGKEYHNRKAEIRRARKNNAVCTLTKDEWREILVKYNYCCAYCGKNKPITQDHVIPLSKGGNHTKENVVPACKMCNSRKGVNIWQPSL